MLVMDQEILHLGAFENRRRGVLKRLAWLALIE